MTSRSRLLLGLIALPATLAALPTAGSRPPLIPGSSPGAVDPAWIARMLDSADEATSGGRVAEARKIYRKVADEQRRADQFASAALWRLALNYLYADEPRRAAEVMDGLAADANRFGDPTTELRATFEAAALWQQLRRQDLVTPRLERARALLQSPVIADGEKASVRARMG